MVPLPIDSEREIKSSPALNSSPDKRPENPPFREVRIKKRPPISREENNSENFQSPENFDNVEGNRSSRHPGYGPRTGSKSNWWRKKGRRKCR